MQDYRVVFLDYAERNEKNSYYILVIRDMQSKTYYEKLLSLFFMNIIKFFL